MRLVPSWRYSSADLNLPFLLVTNSSNEDTPRSLSSQDAVVVGRVTGCWGLRGDLKVESHTDFSRRFSPGSVLYLGGRVSRVERSREYRGGLLVKFDLVNDRSQAESLRGTFLTVPLDDVKPLPPGSYYHFQIIDIGVWTEGGEYLGEVKEILGSGANDVYVVRDEDNREVLVPALKSVILEVHPRDKKMVVRLPQGL